MFARREEFERESRRASLARRLDAVAVVRRYETMRLPPRPPRNPDVRFAAPDRHEDGPNAA